MQITILTYGTREDVQPFIALTVGLQKAGYHVLLAVPHRLVALAALYNVPAFPLPGDPEEISRKVNDAGNILNTFRSEGGYVSSISAEVLSAAITACSGADLIIHSYFFTTVGHSLASARGISDISVQLFPIFAPTRAFPSIAMPNLPPGLRSYFSHWLFTQVFWHYGNLGYRRLASDNPGVGDLKLYWPFDNRNGAPTPLIFAFSPALLPRPKDWKSPHIHITGSFNLQTPPNYHPPQKLVDFLAAGDPPVCISFGSMLNLEAQHTDQLLRSVLQQTGQRGIFLTGWGEKEQAGAAQDNLLYLDAIPHDWLLPRCKSIVHHGGAGTTHAALRGGIPNIVIPHTGDQLFWAKRISASGAGPRPLVLKHLTVEALTAAFNLANSREMRLRAKSVSQLICAEDGVSEAVRLIEGRRIERQIPAGNTASAHI